MNTRMMFARGVAGAELVSRRDAEAQRCFRHD